MNYRTFYKSTFLFLIIISAISFDFISTGISFKAIYFSCNGQQRWDIKTLQDANATLIDFTPNTSYNSITKIKTIAKNVWHETDPRSNVEYQTVKFTCKILKYKEEAGTSGDNDYHIVIYQGTNTTKTMVAEIPKSTCPNVSTSTHAQEFADARQVIDDNDDGILTGEWHKVKNKKFTIYGVLFRDKKHNAVGQLPNYVEIHPVLKLEVN